MYQKLTAWWWHCILAGGCQGLSRCLHWASDVDGVAQSRGRWRYRGDTWPQKSLPTRTHATIVSFDVKHFSIDFDVLTYVVWQHWSSWQAIECICWNSEIYFKQRNDVKHLAVRDVKAESIGKLVCVKGIVTRTTEVKPMMQVATYTCDQCGAETYQPVSDDVHLPPMRRRNLSIGYLVYFSRRIRSQLLIHGECHRYT